MDLFSIFIIIIIIIIFIFINSIKIDNSQSKNTPSNDSSDDIMASSFSDSILPTNDQHQEMIDTSIHSTSHQTDSHESFSAHVDSNHDGACDTCGTTTDTAEAN